MGTCIDVERQSRRPQPLRELPEAAQRFSSTPESVAAAREFVASTLSDSLPKTAPTVELIDDARLIVSELVTNAVKTTAGDVEVLVQFGPARVRVTVADHAGGAPERRQADVEAVSGRGLQIVAAVAQAWGYELTEDGKRVWADLRAASQSRPAAARGRTREGRVT